MAFGDEYRKLGWTVITLSNEKAIELNFDVERTEMHDWLSQIKNEWVKTSYRTIAFKNKNDALIFKLTYC